MDLVVTHIRRVVGVITWFDIVEGWPAYSIHFVTSFGCIRHVMGKQTVWCSLHRTLLSGLFYFRRLTRITGDGKGRSEGILKAIMIWKTGRLKRGRLSDKQQNFEEQNDWKSGVWSADGSRHVARFVWHHQISIYVEICTSEVLCTSMDNQYCPKINQKNVPERRHISKDSQFIVDVSLAGMPVCLSRNQ